MSNSPKPEKSASGFESDGQTLNLRHTPRKQTLPQSVGTSLTALALCCGITALGLSAHQLYQYRCTHLPSEYMLPLWPENFELRPTIALVAGSVLVVVFNTISLALSKATSLRNNRMLCTIVSFAAPLVSFVAATVAMALFYSINTSTTDDTLQSWSCRWDAVVMTYPPHFSTLCQEAKAGLYLAVVLVPLEAIILGVAGWQFFTQKKVLVETLSERAASASPIPE